MQECQQQNIHQNPFPNQACALNMNRGCSRVNSCCNSFMGQPYGNQFGSGGAISSFAMAGAGAGGAFAFAGNNSLGGGFNNLFQPPFGGGGYGGGYGGGFDGGFGNGLGFGSPFAGGLPFGGSNLNLSLGINLRA